MSSSSAALNVSPAAAVSRSLLSRVVERAPLAQCLICAVLFVTALVGVGLLRSARDTSDRAIEAVRLVSATKATLANEMIARDAYDKQPTKQNGVTQSEAQQATFDALRLLAVAPHSSAAHHLVMDETIALHRLAAGTMGRAVALLPVEQSLRHASDAILAETQQSVARADAMQDGVFIVTTMLFGGGLGTIALLVRLSGVLQRQREQRVVDAAAAVCFNERRFRSLVHNAADMVLLADGSGRVIYQSPSAESGWGHAAGSLMSCPVVALTHPDERNAILELGLGPQPLAQAGARQKGVVARADARLLDGAGQWRDAELIVSNLLANPDVQAIVVVARDIGDRKAREKALMDEALHDRLTGLPNLPLLQDRLDQALVRARRHKAPVGLLLARIHASTGEDGACTAQQVLETVGRLRMCIRAADTVARLHDGTLAVILEELEDVAAARAVAQRISAECNRLAHPDLPGTPVPLAIGMAFGDPVNATVGTLMQQAGLALHRAGFGRWVLFEADMQERALDRTELGSDLRMADLRKEMRISYQPVMRLAEPTLLGFEAAVTWHHPVLGAVDSATFAALADETGLAVPVGRWVLEACCREVAGWQKQSRLTPPLSVMVKIAARQFHTSSLEADVAHALEAAGLAPECLMLEIGEAALLHDFETAVRTLWALRDRGVRIAIDGFGSGYSSFPMLRQLPIDSLKLDVAGLESGSDGLIKACAMAAMAGSLDMEVAAEGVETAGQAELLRSWGCLFAQGGLYHPPLDAEEAEKLVLAVARSRTVGQAKASAEPLLRRRSPGRVADAGTQPGEQPGLNTEVKRGGNPDWPGEAAEPAAGYPDAPRPGPRPKMRAPEPEVTAGGRGDVG
jgi:PAS domain S-box-containing protein